MKNIINTLKIYILGTKDVYYADAMSITIRQYKDLRKVMYD